MPDEVMLRSKGSPFWRGQETGSLVFCLRAFSLVEVVIALGVVSFALVAMLGILPIGMGAASDAVHFTAASQIAGAIDCDLRSAPATAQIYPRQTGTNDFYLDSLGNVVLDPDAAKFRARVTITSQGGSIPASYVSILLAWPAGAAITRHSSHLEVASFLSQ